jgi:hypothetical protein
LAGQPDAAVQVDSTTVRTSSIQCAHRASEAMSLLFAIFLAVHGLIHLLGFIKAVGLAELPQLSQPISPRLGVVWLAATLLFLATAAALFLWPRGWWAIGVCALAVSLFAIGHSWADAKFGALADAIVLLGVAFGLLAHGPASLLASYERDVDRGLERGAATAPVEESDLAPLPAPVQRYLRTAGVVGGARVRNVRARMHGRIRSGPDAPWITLSVEQYNFVAPPARMFYLTGSMYMIPVQGYHRYTGPSATMRVKAAALVPVVDASGPEMDQGETVTMFNDMCVMAPATLIDPAIVWEPIDARSARATFTNAGHTIRAELTFNDAGELTDFRSDDRYQTAPDGRSARKVRWSTPIGSYRSFGAVRLASHGEGRWHEAGGDYAYIELTIDDVEYNVRSR